MKNLLLFFLLLITISCFAPDTGSIKKIDNGNLSPQKRLKALVELSAYFSSKDPENTFRPAKMGLSLAGKLNNKKSAGSFLKDMGKAWFLTRNYDSAAYYLDRSAIVFKKINDN